MVNDRLLRLRSQLPDPTGHKVAAVRADPLLDSVRVLVLREGAMQHVESLHEQAAECLRLADAEQSSEQRVILISIAHAWLALAEQRERLPPAHEADA